MGNIQLELEIQKLEETIAELRAKVTIMGLDSLTQLPNRGAFDKELKRFQSYHRRGETFSLILMDVDDFKLINDSCGHEAGDRALIGLAAVLRTYARGHDFASRWGGDEFTLLIQGGVDDAMQMAERLRMEIRKRVSVGGLPLSISWGVASCKSIRDGESILSAADRQLLAAKKDRKGCVRGPLPQEVA